MNKQRGNVLVVSLVVIIGLAIFGTLGYLLYQNFIVKNRQTETNVVPETIQQEKPPTTKVFRSQEYNMTFRYPSNWSVVEKVQDGNTPEWYGSSVDVRNNKGAIVASLETGGQIGGLCSEDAPFVPTSTIIKDPLELKGIGHTNFGYTLVQSSEGNYGVAFGLHKDDLAFGDSSVQCPAMSINYRYYITSDTKALGGMNFGLWYAESQQNGDPNKHQMFQSRDDATTYSQSDEFKQIKLMIESLSIGI